MKTKIFYIALLSFALLSCTKENEKMSPGTLKIVPFKVTTGALEAKVGEPVSFLFEGNADTVYFWSGEFGKDYNYRNGREVPVENPTLTIDVGSSYGHQPSLSLWISQDFNGNYTYEDVMAATWVDITTEFNIPAPILQSPANTVQRSKSPPVDLFGFIADKDKPYYLGVRNKLNANSSGANTTQWYFYKRDFKFEGIVNGVTVSLFDFDNDWGGFVHQGYTGTQATMPYLSPTTNPTSLFFGRNVPSANAMDTWGITKMLSLKANLGKDSGTIIKRVTDLPLEEYQYLYAAPGEYDVTFTTMNKDRTAHVVQLKVTVVPND